MLIKTIFLSLLMTMFNDISGSGKLNGFTQETNEMNQSEKLDVATFGSGCFWCTEAVFEIINGVESVISGYSGGQIKNPSYQQVSTGRTGHAEVCQIWFDPSVISYEELLEVFWHTHDPTTLNRQGNDIGPQYRSVIFYHSDQQKEAASRSKKEMDASGTFSNPIVTEITAFEDFYKAEDYHQEYFANNPRQPYCTVIVKPKVEKFKARYQDLLK
jgi:peptide-methionine (S)-S-oxide reductase